jgi:hypothetical protein
MTTTIITAIVAGCLALVGSLIVFSLRSIKDCIHQFIPRVDKCENSIREIDKTIAACKVDCDRNMVSKEDWVRSEGYTRKELKGLGNTLARIEGKVAITEKIPELCGNMVRDILKDSKG